MDVVDKKTRSFIMSRIRSKSSIEVLPGWAKGLYLRKHPAGVEGRPDFGNKRKKVALFIDGVFWHGGPGWKCPKSNSGFWKKKIRRNRARDWFVNDYLLWHGWRVIRVWEGDEKAYFDR